MAWQETKQKQHRTGNVLGDSAVGKVASNETLGVEDGVLRVAGSLLLGGLTDEALRGLAILAGEESN